MSLPSYLKDLPSLSEPLHKIEQVMLWDKNQNFGEWLHQPYLPDETDPWTQKQWFRYDDFMRAGRMWGLGHESFLPTPENRDREIPTTATTETSPFSPLSMIAALDLCGYKPRPITLEDIRLLFGALEAAAQADLDEIFTSSELPTHIGTYSIHHQDDDERPENRCYGGAKAAQSIKYAIVVQMQALSTWASVGELLDQVDWTDEQVLMDLASDPDAVAQRDTSNPLSDMLEKVDVHEAGSATRLRMLFQEWALQEIPVIQALPKWWEAYPRGMRPEVSDRFLQAKTLRGMDRFQKALTRVCRSSLHARVPPQIALLELEMVQLENPNRSKKLSATLARAIGYHYSVVQFHYMLRKLIYDKASDCAGWSDRSINKMSGRSRHRKAALAPDQRVMDVPYIRLRRLITRRRLKDPTFRDYRLNQLSFHLGPINWAHYLYVDLESTPTIVWFDGPALKITLDMACVRAFGFALAELMDTRSADPESNPEGYSCQPLPYQESDADAAVLTLKDPTRTVTYEEKVRCLYNPVLHRQRVTIAASERTIQPEFETSAPLAQSSHSYLRDNPPPARPSEKLVTTETPAPPPVDEEGEEETPRFFVNSAQMKVVERLMGKREGVVRWSQLINLFKRIGFRAEGMGGSAFHITPVVPGGKSILLYRPHPEPSFTPAQIIAVGSQIGSTFGWSIDTFVRQGEVDGESPGPRTD